MKEAAMQSEQIITHILGKCWLYENPLYFIVSVHWNINGQHDRNLPPFILTTQCHSSELQYMKSELRKRLIESVAEYQRHGVQPVDWDRYNTNGRMRFNDLFEERRDVLHPPRRRMNDEL
jgi:hypothetical protein